MTIRIAPMPHTMREMPAHWRPTPPPMFPDGAPTAADRELAIELWRALDLESRRWYYVRGSVGSALGLTAKDVATLKLESNPYRR